MVSVEQLCGLAPRAAAAIVEAELNRAGCPDADFDARELVHFASGQDVRRGSAPLDKACAARLAALTGRRTAREPLQYLLGSWAFLDFELKVGPGVLCPRADTEIVAESAAQGLSADIRVLDLCAGSGCLGLGVKRFCPQAELTFVEKSPEAWPYLIENAAHALDGNAAKAAKQGGVYGRAVQGDVFEYWKTLAPGSFDLIVSNPPYLTAQEMAVLQPEVAREPAMALAAGEDGLVFYRLIAEHYLKALCPGGRLALEIGWQQRGAVCALLEENGWREVNCIRDYGGNDRCILAMRPTEETVK